MVLNEGKSLAGFLKGPEAALNNEGSRTAFLYTSCHKTSMMETMKDFFQKAGILVCPFFQILPSFYISISHI